MDENIDKYHLSLAYTLWVRSTKITFIDMSLISFEATTFYRFN